MPNDFEAKLVAVAGAKNSDGSYALSSAVRELCGDEYETMPFGEVMKLPVGSRCPTCRGRGWNPSKDLAVWIKAANALGLHVGFWPQPSVIFVEGPGEGDNRQGKGYGEPFEGLVNALANALVAQGAKLMEVTNV